MMTQTDFVGILQERAATALQHWGLDHREARLIKYRENAVFRIRLANGCFAALRLHRPGYHPRDTILSELLFVAHLVGHGACAPAPQPALDGSLLVASERLPDGQVQYASIIAWMDGAPLGPSGCSSVWGKRLHGCMALPIGSPQNMASRGRVGIFRD
jgi:Ser/Thr protein kinase RdoA (MazF antagonist)